ncbi:unnamed protein product [Cylindrotheca closterium]|uniref:Uncharacterized protein n=1 Tax=Cylindrotheca closterium TaxID=2856 RepID=A0AAD2FUZ6_9STRA|nr:unnamed protein product [Cylindrotheca closterium]
MSPHSPIRVGDTVFSKSYALGIVRTVLTETDGKTETVKVVWDDNLTTVVHVDSLKKVPEESPSRRRSVPRSTPRSKSKANPGFHDGYRKGAAGPTTPPRLLHSSIGIGDTVMDKHGQQGKAVEEVTVTPDGDSTIKVSWDAYERADIVNVNTLQKVPGEASAKKKSVLKAIQGIVHGCGKGTAGPDPIAPRMLLGSFDKQSDLEEQPARKKVKKMDEDPALARYQKLNKNVFWNKEPFKGTQVAKMFEGREWHEGYVRCSWVEENGRKKQYSLIYTDGDREDVDLDELKRLVANFNRRKEVICIDIDDNNVKDVVLPAPECHAQESSNPNSQLSSPSANDDDATTTAVNTDTHCGSNRFDNASGHRDDKDEQSDDDSVLQAALQQEQDSSYQHSQLSNLNAHNDDFNNGADKDVQSEDDSLLQAALQQEPDDATDNTDGHRADEDAQSEEDSVLQAALEQESDDATTTSVYTNNHHARDHLDNTGGHRADEAVPSDDSVVQAALQHQQGQEEEQDPEPSDASSISNVSADHLDAPDDFIDNDEDEDLQEIKRHHELLTRLFKHLDLDQYLECEGPAPEALKVGVDADSVGILTEDLSEVNCFNVTGLEFKHAKTGKRPYKVRASVARSRDFHPTKKNQDPMKKPTTLDRFPSFTVGHLNFGDLKVYLSIHVLHQGMVDRRCDQAIVDTWNAVNDWALRKSTFEKIMELQENWKFYSTRQSRGSFKETVETYLRAIQGMRALGTVGGESKKIVFRGQFVPLLHINLIRYKLQSLSETRTSDLKGADNKSAFLLCWNSIYLLQNAGFKATWRECLQPNPGTTFNECRFCPQQDPSRYNKWMRGQVRKTYEEARKVFVNDEVGIQFET